MPTLSDHDAPRFEPDELERMLGRTLARSASMSARRRHWRRVLGGAATAVAVATALTTVIVGAPDSPSPKSAQSQPGSTGPAWRLVSDVSAGWQVLGGPTVGDGLPAVQLTCMSATTCYALGAVSSASPSSRPGAPPNDAIEVTTDGGHTWTSVTLPSAISGAHLSCLTATTCAVVGIGAGGTSVLDQTTDGARTWSSGSGPAELTSGDFVGGLDCTTATHCTAIAMPHLVAVGTSHIMSLTTSDGGKSWSEGSLPDGFDGPPYGLTCTSGADCVVVGSDSSFPGGDASVAYSRDGGQTWTSSAVPNGTSDLHAASCSNSFCIASSLGSASSTPRTILTSSDGGATWSDINTTGLASNVMPFISSFSCPTSTDCWTGGTVPPPGSGTAVQISDARGLLAQSLDGGHTWHDTQLPSSVHTVISVSCPTARDCYALAAVDNANGLSFALLAEHS